MKRILKIVLGLVILLVAVVVFAIEPIAKWAIESEGSKQVGAKVEVDSVDIKFYPTHVALNGLTVANPKEPMRNLMQSEKVSADVDIKALLKKQVIADQVLLSGLQMHTQRSTPGTLDGSMPPPKPEQKEGLPSIELPDASAIMDEEKAIVQAEVEEIEAGFKAIQNRWEEKSQNMPEEAQVEEYKQRWEELKEQNMVVRLQGAKELRDDIKAELKQYKSFNKDLQADIAEVQALAKRAANLPKAQSQRIASKYGLDQGTDGMLRFLLGDDATAMVQSGLTLYKQTMAELSKPPAEPEPSTEGGELPVNILIREILIDGYQMVGEEKLAYSGEIRDVTDNQDYWNKPITMAIKGGMAEKSQLLIDGVFDQRDDILKSVLTMGLEQLSLNGVALSQNPALPLTLEQGIADIAANFSIEGDSLSGSIDGLVNQVKLLVANAAEGNPTMQRLASALEGVNQLVMDLNVKGSVDDPIIRLKSNLDRILGDVLGEELKGRVDELKVELQDKLQSQYGDQLASLQQKKDILGQYSQLLGDREAALQAVMKEML
ncbi:TIGR03545 family protein [Spongiibacter nanhainus]|uniref:TIGR03545 family protein n=1 Tax=Spongiibacter nanhainus TaxID=2794344 RepID=A0A7T4UQ56_9GAMM|nr:TIGR03545 family protein [Spongiibacter nanhainus]QQD18408.1 TIGR03545 family protein [Spongiibacter nanhainus]